MSTMQLPPTMISIFLLLETSTWKIQEEILCTIFPDQESKYTVEPTTVRLALSRTFVLRPRPNSLSISKCRNISHVWPNHSLRPLLQNLICFFLRLFYCSARSLNEFLQNMTPYCKKKSSINSNNSSFCVLL